MVFGSDDDVFHARVLCDSHPLVGIVLNRVELRHELGVFGHGDLLPIHHPLTPARDGINSPVNEQAEPPFAPPLHAGGCGTFTVFDRFRFRLFGVAVGGGLLLGEGGGERAADAEKELIGFHDDGLWSNNLRAIRGLSMGFIWPIGQIDLSVGKEFLMQFEKPRF